MTEPKAGVVVVGSLHYDLMVDAPDRPRKGETVTGTRWYPKFGGKGGNQAVAAHNADADTRFIGALGTDNFADFMLEALKSQGLDTQWITKTKTCGSGMSVAIMDAEGDYGAVIVTGANAILGPDHLHDESIWSGAKTLILQNEIPESANLHAAQVAKDHGMLIGLNAAPSRPLSDELLNLVDVLVVNAIEAQDLCDVAVNDLTSALSAAIALANRVPHAIVTAGGDGVAYAANDHKAFSIEAETVELVSTHGAGDVFVGTLFAALARETDMKTAVTESNYAAALHVSRKLQTGNGT